MARVIFILIACAILTQGCGSDSPSVMTDEAIAAVADAVEQRVRWIF
ncbi:MAG: hypothetical protein GWN00_27895 [Aliifodinibius sp.]|nr:hypothetical protein [Fodinibius sp.]NIV14627.1 hypothetical protein [Fodinibius sp.]NIY28487.1 hypothetical protein [Fodinibius sp.]